MGQGVISIRKWVAAWDVPAAWISGCAIDGSWYWRVSMGGRMIWASDHNTTEGAVGLDNKGGIVGNIIRRIRLCINAIVS